MSTLLKNISLDGNDKKAGTPGKDFFGTMSSFEVNGSMIGSITSSNYYTFMDTPIIDVADNLLHREDIYAVGVLDNNYRPMGVLDRRYLFDIVGKPFGRDLSVRKPIGEVTIQTKSFNYTSNIFSVSESLGEILYSGEIEYYLLNDHDHRFMGIFSTRDMLIYLSRMMRKDIEIARHLQLSIVPEKTMNENSNIAIIGSSLMAKGVGGDYYSFNKFNDNSWIISICDVSAKGIGASLLTSIIDGMTSIYDFSRPVKELIISLNEYIFNNFDRDKFITGAFTILNEKTGQVMMYDLGHSHVYMLRDNKIVKIKSSKENIPLGIIGEYKPEPVSFTLKKGEMLILLTDGMVEEINSSGIPFGIEKTAKIIFQNRNSGLDILQQKLLGELITHRGSLPQHDDITLVMVEKR